MAVPDLDGAVIAVYDPRFFEIVTPETIFIDTPRGQHIEAHFSARNIKGERLEVAVLPKK